MPIHCEYCKYIENVGPDDGYLYALRHFYDGNTGITRHELTKLAPIVESVKDI